MNYLIEQVRSSRVGNYLRPSNNYRHFFNINAVVLILIKKIVSEYDQEIPQSQTADNLVAPRGRAAQPSRDTRKTN